MHADKLLRIAYFLENYVQDDWFDLEVFAEKGFEERKCGTVACVWGWCSQIEEWRDVIRLEPCSIYEDSLNVVYNGKKNFRAAVDFFDIPFDHVEFLFDPNYYKNTTKQDVISRIRKYVESGGALNCDKENEYSDHYNEDIELDDFDDYSDDFIEDEYDDE